MLLGKFKHHIDFKPLTQKRKSNPFTLAKALLIAGLTLLLIAEGFFGYRLYELSARQEAVKADYSNINNIAYGLFSVEQWRDEVARIVNKQVRNMKFTPKQKQLMRKEVEEVLHALVDKAEAMLNKKPKSLGGKIRKLVIKTFVKADKIRAQIPKFARSIIAKVDNPNQKAKLSSMIMSEFKEMQKSTTMDSTLKANQALFNSMYLKYGVKSTPELNNKLNNQLKQLNKEMYSYCFGMIACIVIVLSLWWFLRTRVDLHGALFILSLLFAFILLAVGLNASMIEVDCRIKTLDFVLLGEHVIFKDQVLFYESKSILGVVKVLVQQTAIDSVAVGILILCFSILFPVMKLTSTGIHLFARKQLAENRVIKYFAFKSGKWSMADVIVIAILMTYIGLNGLLDSQLAFLNISTQDLSIITTNNTALMPGYIIFISFVLYGLTLSTILKYITPNDAS